MVMFCWMTLTIFPVFAGMIREDNRLVAVSTHFPRIRGDDPFSGIVSERNPAFSPYSRG